MPRTAKSDPLAIYKKKRNFAITPEPADGGEAAADGAPYLQFVIQKHWATRLHYDLRLELNGTMKSWAVPKGPSYDTADKRMAVQVEDHPISYNTFEGQIPPKQYGSGKVIVWDKGYWQPIGDAEKGYREGKLKFRMFGHKMQGAWTLVRMHSKGASDEKKPAWLLIKEHDGLERASTEFDLVQEMPDSVKKLPAVQLPKDATPVAKSATLAAKKGTEKKDATSLPGKQAPLPATFAPQLATLVDEPPSDSDDWIYELKFDGYRLLTRIQGSSIKLFTRNGNDWTSKMPALVKAIQTLKLTSAWLDGEILVMDEHGVPDFQALQNGFDTKSTRDIVYYLFDAPYLSGRDIRELPVLQRREALQLILSQPHDDKIRFSEAFDASPSDLVSSACQIGFEGVIGKRKTAAYSSKRTPDWIKLKCSHRQEFVIGGYTDPKGSRTGIGSLLLGVHDKDGQLLYAGNVGTGFSERTLKEIKIELDKIGAAESPFADSTGIDRKSHWVKPKLLAEVSFAEWTDSNHIRHSVFHGLRADKPARAIVREEAKHMDGKQKTKAAGKLPVAKKSVASKSAVSLAQSLPKNLRVTHPERVIDESTGVTKFDLVRYYALVGPLMMEHLKGRPVSLVRAPEGVKGELFFQKHEEKGQMPGVDMLDPALDVGHASLLEVAKPEGLLSAAQMNVIEFHTWNATKDKIGRPDRITFDLDPGEGLAWHKVQEGAELVRVMLQELGLPAFLKTSGGKGLHVVVPIKRLHDWDMVKAFSEAVVQHLARTIPDRFVAKSGPKNRVGKIFVDYLRNGWGATTASAWSARARPGMGVSVPVAWKELGELTSGAHWTIRSVEARLREGNAPWKGYAKASVSIGSAMKALAATE